MPASSSGTTSSGAQGRRAQWRTALASPIKQQDQQPSAQLDVRGAPQIPPEVLQREQRRIVDTELIGKVDVRRAAFVLDGKLMDFRRMVGIPWPRDQLRNQRKGQDATDVAPAAARKHHDQRPREKQRRRLLGHQREPRQEARQRAHICALEAARSENAPDRRSDPRGLHRIHVSLVRLRDDHRRAERKQRCQQPRARAAHHSRRPVAGHREHRQCHHAQRDYHHLGAVSEDQRRNRTNDGCQRRVGGPIGERSRQSAARKLVAGRERVGDVPRAVPIGYARVARDPPASRCHEDKRGERRQLRVAIGSAPALRQRVHLRRLGVSMWPCSAQRVADRGFGLRRRLERAVLAEGRLGADTRKLRARQPAGEHLLRHQGEVRQRQAETYRRITALDRTLTIAA